MNYIMITKENQDWNRAVFDAIPAWRRKSGSVFTEFRDGVLVAWMRTDTVVDGIRVEWNA